MKHYFTIYENITTHFGVQTVIIFTNISVTVLKGLEKSNAQDRNVSCCLHFLKDLCLQVAVSFFSPCVLDSCNMAIKWHKRSWFCGFKWFMRGYSYDSKSCSYDCLYIKESLDKKQNYSWSGYGNSRLSHHRLQCYGPSHIPSLVHSSTLHAVHSSTHNSTLQQEECWVLAKRMC